LISEKAARFFSLNRSTIVTPNRYIRVGRNLAYGFYSTKWWWVYFFVRLLVPETKL
jgi:hypothetical protein